MSKTSSKRKTKRKKLRKVVPKDPAVRLYESLKKDYGDKRVPKELANERYIPLMKRVVEGNMPVSALSTLVDTTIFCGTLEELLGEGDTSIPREIVLENVSTPEYYLPVLAGLGAEGRDGLRVYGDVVRSLRYHATQPTIPRGKTIYCKVQKIEQLPADMRKWTEQQRVTFLQVRSAGIKISNVIDPERLASHYLRDGNPATEKLHQIRRINGYPSKAQRRRISRDAANLNNHKIDSSFSLDQ